MSVFEDILNEEDDVTETETPVEASETTEPVEAVADTPEPAAPSNEAPVPDAVEAQPITRDDGAQWSEKAKRWYLDGKIVAGEPPATPTPAPSEPSIPKVAEPAPVAEVPKAPTFAGDPFEFRGAGRKHAIPGAVIDKDGWTHIPPDAQAQHRALLAAAAEHNLNWPRERQSFQQQLKDAETRSAAQSKKYNDASVFLFDKLAGLLQEHPQELNLIQRELGIMLKAADLSIPRGQAQPEASEEQVEQAFAATLTGYIDEVLETVPKGLFTAEDIADLKQTAHRRMAAYAAQHEGQIVLDTHAVNADLDREIKIAQRAQQQAAAAATAAQKAREAAAFNAANAPKVPVAPTPKKPTPKPAAAAAVPSGQRPGWDQSFKSAWDEHDDEE